MTKEQKIMMKNIPGEGKVESSKAYMIGLSVLGIAAVGLLAYTIGPKIVSKVQYRRALKTAASAV